ncbi:cell surface protein [Oscillospiraceae bacterium N12]|jgi:hypothetical protein|uniref:Cell surface protein n=1 Tax=Jilunia laotingensis TaxID=2763675 RepID=A0A926IRH8_9BACT|nr:hypothetical protein [Jilunia laotingensis]MBC8593728.1 cell surface protein [Jilunia laotingensis]
MKKLRTTFTSLITALLLTGCQKDIPMVSLGIDSQYRIDRMKSLILHPEFTGKRYTWNMKDRNGNDSLVTTDRDFIFVGITPGEYYLRLNIINEQNPVEHNVHITVEEENIAYSRYITKVYEYCPAPGQFINTIPPYETGNSAEDMREKAENSIKGTNDILVSLGGYGGYITFGFDHTVANVPGKKDFKILANAFYAEANPNPDAPESGGSCEPGIVMVSIDLNQNGLPDDEWYELAGSEYYKPETRHNYQITYHKPSPDKIPTPEEGTPITDNTYIQWETNSGEIGYISKNAYHFQDYYPKWIQEDNLTFTGTKLNNNAVDESGGKGSFYVLYAYDWGYVDNHPNDKEDKISFDIDWAVDREGNPVYLPGVDFIRVYTGVNQQCGWLGETSTEISRAEDLHVKDITNFTPNP